MRVFVTGATGFIGLHLCRTLAARGDRVIALVRSQKKAEKLPAGVERFEGDLSVFADPKTVLPSSDVVIHLAGVVAAGKLDDYRKINFQAVKDLLDCVGRQSWQPARLLFASSLAAAGPSPADRPWVEADPTQPIDDYGTAKARAEPLVRNASFPTTSFRPPMVFGPGDEATLTLFRSASRGIGMRVAGASQRLSFVDVRDLVSGIVRMADDRRPGCFVYYVSHPRSMDVRELWRELGHAVGRDVRVLAIPRWCLYLAMLVSSGLSRVIRFKNQLDLKQYQQMTAPAFACSSELITRELGWRPEHDLRETLENAARGYRALGMLQ
jgi:nucleoside-diphosphate-sugar epimerase